MTQLQEEFLSELKSKPKLTVAEYAQIYTKHNILAIEEEKKKGAGEKQAVTMGNYYTVSILSKFIGNENILSRVIALKESEEE
ncbi:MAG: hypothetical protein Q9M40_11495 [Sulfurimonas sp.]|nr:hypothetical protein [Sulfurimonas sp.]MDQ7068541.1 hypothetical protein [Sulfurimonas sp.]